MTYPKASAFRTAISVSSMTFDDASEGLFADYFYPRLFLRRTPVDDEPESCEILQQASDAAK